MVLKTLIVVFLVTVEVSDSARILGVVPIPSYSHQVVFRPIWKELSTRGHQVVTITTDPIKDPSLVNLTEIDIKSTYDVWNKNIVNFTTTTPLKSFFAIVETILNVSEHILGHRDVQNLIKNETEYFDVVIVEYTLMSPLAFAKRFKAPLIVGSSMDGFIELHHLMGNPIHFMLYPICILPVHYDLSFTERILVAMFNLFSKLTMMGFIATEDNKVRKFFGNGYPSVTELAKNISLVLSNSDPIFHKVKPLLPTTVEFGGGTHRVAPQPLPEELKKMLDSAKYGFIYFSLGSNVKSKFLSEHTRGVMMQTFTELPYTILWKFEDDKLPNKPANVFTSKWFPQQDILKHPNIKLFITQGGLQSIDEAIYDYVPMLIMPFFGDQRFNAYRMVAKGCALSIDYETMTKEEFKAAILEVINNPKYKNRIMELSKLAQDQPMTGIEKAVWWIEYVIRHKGTAHLRSPYLDMPAYQYYYLDMIAVFGLAILILLGILVALMKLLIKVLSLLFYRKTKAKVDDSARILGVVPTPSYSHQVAFRPIWKELSLRGHQVVIVTTDPINDPSLVNLTEIDIGSAYDLWNNNIAEITSTNPLKSLFLMLETISNVHKQILSHRDVENLIKNKTEYFDVVIIEYTSRSMFAFANRFQAPLIVGSSLDATVEMHYLMGNPIHSMLYPSYLLPVHQNMSFFERVLATLFHQVLFKLIMREYYIDQNNNIKTFFGDDYPSAAEIDQNISLMLTNSDPIFHKVKPLVPTIVEFGGGTHRVAPKPLPTELKRILDAAENGFIYFSLGSNVRSKFLSEHIRSVIMKTFAELPYTILWKFEDDHLPNKSSNVITSKWLPQQDILKHPKIKLFITQGGLQSMDEALYDHVPMLVMPVFADQRFNAYRIVAKGCAVLIDYQTMTKDDFKKAILEVIDNPKYKNRIIELTKLVQDQPMSGIEKAIWWIEYVIRHNGTAHLRSPYLDMPAYQFFYLDMIAVNDIDYIKFLSKGFISKNHHVISHYSSNAMDQKTLSVAFLLIVKFSDSARILGIVPVPCHSHQVALRPLWKELSLKGHQVVTITTDPINDPSMVNLTEIDINFAYNLWNHNIADITSTNPLKSLFIMVETMCNVNQQILSHRDVNNLLKNETEYFDVVIAEYSLHSMFAFAKRFKVPLIVASSLDGSVEMHHIMGNPIHSMLYPYFLLPVHQKLSFSERILVALYNLFYSKLIMRDYLIQQNDIIKKFFGDDYPTVAEIEHNISLMLTNSDPIFYKVKPLVPTIIEFGGGTHRVAPKPLPKELKTILDSSENGFIYFSLGSNAKSKNLPEDTRNIIMETFAELPYTVLWKFENDTLPNKPINVITSKWLPQQDILKHPKIKLFITQGGLQSMDEALYDHVPMLVMPVFGDQRFNAYRMVSKGCAVMIDYQTMTKDDFKKAILEVINNPKYKNRIIELTKLVQDQPMSGIEKAIWWIEYVIRHNGTAHLRSPYLDMPAYQFFYLDMIAVFGLAILVLIMMDQKTLAVALLLVFEFGDCARILGVVPTPCYSHQVVFRPIWKELSLRGHQVVTLTTDPIKDPNLVNLTEIDLNFVYDVWNKNLPDMATTNPLQSFLVTMEAMFTFNEHVLAHSDVQNLIKNETEYFDVVIVEYGLLSMLAFAERFKAPLVLGSSLETTIEIHYLMGNPIHFMIHPHYILPVHHDLFLTERVFVLLFNLFSPLILWNYNVVQDDKVKRFFGDGYPSVTELVRNISLVLTNSDPIFYKVKPLLPTIVEFGGGTHRVASKPLPEELKTILDSTEEGFIYFSLGSTVKSKFLSKRTRSVIMETFAELPYTVLWKFEDDNLINKPDNVITSKWFPQQDIFKHPKIKLFITQGGLQSMDEAVYEHVPMLVMPFFGDQSFNAYRMIAKGCALLVDYQTMTKESFKKAILEVIINPKYKNRIMELAKLAEDQPMNGIEKAVWWIEYVIRHKGTTHLRSPYLDMHAYQFLYLDVIATFGLAFLILIGVFVVVAKLLLKMLSVLFYRKFKLKLE
ncbi:hypothetical protein RN001_014690 [Aquatica leii]|uniref:UDP-glucuronosyltransferase n=1 Tax=Aquatica leii TaxID=1421715 RepID=A0AAN7P292_9COLE|nr:hypothetical protein RN001_014690 [Aquatica leii]